MAGRLGLGFLKGGNTTVPSGVIIAWPSTNASIPTGYSRATAYDGRFVKMIATSGTNPGTTGGATSHSHSSGGTHTHSVPDHTHASPTTSLGTNHDTTDNSNGANVYTFPWNAGAHSHSLSIASAGGSTSGTASPDLASTITEPQYLTVIFIKSDGSKGVPANALGYFNGAAPTNFSAYANGANNLWKGAAAAADGGGTGGTNSHTHTVNSHSHSTTPPAHGHAVSTGAYNSGSHTSDGDNLQQNQAPGTTHTHTNANTPNGTAGGGTSGANTDTSASGDMTPAWYKVLTIQNTSGVTQPPPSGFIALWDGIIASIPTKWVICDGTGGTPNLSNGKYTRGANGPGEVGATGGGSHTHGSSSGHTHSGDGSSHSHGSGTTGGVNLTLRGYGTAAAGVGSGTHAVSATNTVTEPALSSASAPASGSDSTDPLYTAVAYIQCTG